LPSSPELIFSTQASMAAESLDAEGSVLRASATRVAMLEDILMDL
jgi:hypothetical protein